MLPSRVLSRINLAYRFRPSISNSSPFSPLQPLLRSCLSFSDFPPLFSITCRLFSQNTGGGIPSLDRPFHRRPNRRACFLQTNSPGRIANSFRFSSSATPSNLHHFGANNSFRFRTYRHPSGKSFRICTSKKQGGGGPLRLFSPLLYPERFLRRVTRRFPRHHPLDLRTTLVMYSVARHFPARGQRYAH